MAFFPMSGRTGTVCGTTGSPEPVPQEHGSGVGPAFHTPKESPVSQQADWPLTDYLELGALPTAVPCARLHTKFVLWEWGLGSVVETAELLVSELTTNAIAASRLIPQRPPIWLRLSADATQVLIEVGDQNPRQPPRDLADVVPGLGDEGGRGLFLVASMSEEWNWYRQTDSTGKVVWCMVAVEQPAKPIVLSALPRRVRTATPTQPVRVMHDPDMLLRLLDGLHKL
jgi:anti-sigma regulatory factor (Ser/Thr protein kinase)